MERVTLINHSDTRGGASVVTMRLMRALCNSGVDARMVVMHKDTVSPRVDAIGGGMRARSAFLAEHAGIFMSNGFNRDDVFRISTARYGMPVASHPWVKDADAVILNWVNQGMLSLKGIADICRTVPAVAWTMHDMWPMTGVCHHAGTCTRYERGSSCGNCPLIRSGRSARDLSTSVQRAKQRLYEGAGRDIRFVAVSRWLAAKAHESALLGEKEVAVIPNAFPVEEFSVTAAMSRHKLHLPEDRRIIIMGAARLDDPVKDLPLAVDTLNAVHAADDSTYAVLFGDIRDPHALDGLRMPHTATGAVTDPVRLRSLMAHADVVLSTSRYETLPGTLVEGIASGAMAVCTGHGGQADIVDDGVNGFIAAEDTPECLSALILRALADTSTRADRHATMSRFAATGVARRYMQLLFSK